MELGLEKACLGRDCGDQPLGNVRDIRTIPLITNNSRGTVAEDRQTAGFFYDHFSSRRQLQSFGPSVCQQYQCFATTRY